MLTLEQYLGDKVTSTYYKVESSSFDSFLEYIKKGRYTCKTLKAKKTVKKIR